MDEQYAKLKIKSNATDEEVKEAFIKRKNEVEALKCLTEEEQQAKNSELEELSNAFDAIMNNRRLQQIKKNQAATNSNENFGEEEKLKNIEQLIEQNRFEEAENELELINPSARNAHWNHLKGIVLLNKGWLSEATKFLEMATKMDPGNAAYRSAYEQVLRQSQGQFVNNQNGFNNQNQQYPPMFCCGGLDCCSRILLAEICCECCGSSARYDYGGGYGC